MSCKIHWTLLYCTPICVLQGIPPRKLSLLSFTVPNPHTGTVYSSTVCTVQYHLNDHQSDHPLLYFFFSIRDFSLRLFWGNFQRGLTVFCSVLTPIYHSNKPIHLKIYDRERKAQITTITSVWRSQVDRVLYVLYRFGWSQSYLWTSFTLPKRWIRLDLLN